MSVILNVGLLGAQEYVPKYARNREAADAGADYWYIVVEPATKAEMDALVRRYDKQGRSERRQREMLADAIMRDRVLEVHGLTLRGLDGDLVTPSNGAELLDAIRPSVELSDAIRGEVLEAVAFASSLEEGLRKNLRSQSDGSSLTTRQKSGPASNAEEPTG